MTASRLHRWAHPLMSFQCELQNVSFSKNVAGGLSRFPVEKANSTELTEFYLHLVINQNNITLNWKKISIESKRDKIVSKVLKSVTNGWPNRKPEVKLSIYYVTKNELSSWARMSNVELQNYYTCEPKKIILESLHSNYLGIMKFKDLETSYM